MAGDWIKMRIDLQTHPKVVRIMSATRPNKFQVIGGLHAVWSIFDTHSEDGFLRGYTLEMLDNVISWEGFSRAMSDVDWLEEVEGGLKMPEFSEHNGKSAKRRAEDMKRKRVSRNSPKSVRKTSAKKKTESGPEKEKDKEKNNKKEKWEKPKEVDPKAWEEFETHRASIRKPLTDEARTKNANVLVDYSPEIQRKIVDKTIASRWAGLFPPKELEAKSEQSTRQSRREL